MHEQTVQARSNFDPDSANPVLHSHVAFQCSWFTVCTLDSPSCHSLLHEASVAAGRIVCLSSVCTIHRQPALSLRTNAHALAGPNKCKNQSPPVFLPYSKVHILQSVEYSMESYERPQPLLTKSGRRRQTSEETLQRKRERDRVEGD